MRNRILTCALLAASCATPALAQRNGNLPVQTMNFDLWCQEQAGLPPERCDKRTDVDEAQFEAYRSKVESYEIPYLQKKQSDAQMDHDMLRIDPVDRPVTQNSEQLRPDLNQPSANAPPR